MQQIDYLPIKPVEQLTGSTTGQKNYAEAWQRAAQFNNPYSEAPSITRESPGESHVNDFSENKIIL